MGQLNEVNKGQLFVRAIYLLFILVSPAPLSFAQSRPSAPVTSDLVNAGRLLDDLKTLSSDAMAGRLAGSAGSASARRLIVERFREVGLQPIGESFEHPFTGPVNTARSPNAGVNVVGRIAGKIRPDRYLIVSAHYDHVGVRGGQIFNGANDNASGAAALSVIAAYFVQHRPETSILFIAFDAEEENLLGSREFVRHPPVPADSILGNVNLDMIGRDADETLWITGIRRFPVFSPMATRVAASSPIRVRIGHDDPKGSDGDDWTRDSDQYAFIEAGIPALYIGVEDSKFLHKPEDDFETMMPTFYVAAVEAIVHLVADIDIGAEALMRARANEQR